MFFKRLRRIIPLLFCLCVVKVDAMPAQVADYFVDVPEIARGVVERLYGSWTIEEGANQFQTFIKHSKVASSSKSTWSALLQRALERDVQSALHIYQLYGVRAFPFNECDRATSLHEGLGWICTAASHDFSKQQRGLVLNALASLFEQYATEIGLPVQENAEIVRLLYGTAAGLEDLNSQAWLDWNA